MWYNLALTHSVVWISGGHFCTKTLSASLSFSRRSIIISLENTFSVSTYSSRASFWEGSHPPSLFILAVFPGVHLIKPLPNAQVNPECATRTFNIDYRFKNGIQTGSFPFWSRISKANIKHTRLSQTLCNSTYTSIRISFFCIFHPPLNQLAARHSCYYLK